MKELGLLSPGLVLAPLPATLASADSDKVSSSPSYQRESKRDHQEGSHNPVDELSSQVTKVH